VSQAQQREKQEGYFHRIYLADRALQAQRADVAQQLLNDPNGCPPELRHWEWKFLNQAVEVPAVGRGGVLLSDRAHPIGLPAVSLAFAPDGGRLAVAFSGAAAPGKPNQAEVRVWNLPNLQDPHKYYADFTGPLRQIVFSPDGGRLATAGGAARDANVVGEVRVWNPEQEAPPAVKTFGDPFNPELAASVAFSLGGGRLGVLTDRAKLHVYEESGAGAEAAVGFGLDQTSFVPRPALGLAALDKAGTKWAAVAADGMSVRVFESSRGQPPATINKHQNEILCVAYSPEANLLATGSRDRTVQVWDLAGKVVATCRGYTGDVTGASFSRDGKRLATASTDGTIRLWDPTTGLEILTINKDPNSKVQGVVAAGVQFSPAKNDWQLATCRGNEVRVYGPPRGAP
jgi:WD40 repeat protein